MSKIASMNFVNFISVGGRSITSLADTPGHEAEILEFPWVAVWPKEAPSRRRMTTIFNVRDCDPLPPEEATEVPTSAAEPVSPRNRRR